MTTLPEIDRTKERMSEILEERGLTFLFPLLRIQSALWKQIQADPVPHQFYKWIRDTLDPAHQSDSGFINALMTVLLKYISQVCFIAISFVVFRLHLNTAKLFFKKNICLLTF